MGRYCSWAASHAHWRHRRLAGRLDISASAECPRWGRAEVVGRSWRRIDRDYIRSIPSLRPKPAGCWGKFNEAFP